MQTQYAKQAKEMLDRCAVAGWYRAADAKAWKEYEESAKKLCTIDGCKVWCWNAGDSRGIAMEISPAGEVIAWADAPRGTIAALRKLALHAWAEDVEAPEALALHDEADEALFALADALTAKAPQADVLRAAQARYDNAVQAWLQARSVVQST